MEYFREICSADLLKKNRHFYDFKSYDCTQEQESEIDNYQNDNYYGISSEIEDPGDTETSHTSMLSNEDVFITRLYREVVDDIMYINYMQESQICVAIAEMKKTIHQGHVTRFRHFDGIDFCKPSNRCGYLRRYAICHTGLVRKSLERYFFRCESLISNSSRFNVLNSNQLKVVSLGGGPGNDLVGFCSALNKIDNCIEKLDLTVVDISKGWESVFPSIIKKAINANFGGFSEVLKRVEVTTNFAQADLNADGIFEDETLASILDEANLVLMVKLVSFMPYHEADNLIQNVVNSMQVGAQLIIIDIPFHKKCFERISCLHPIYHHYLKYNMSFNPLNLIGRSIHSSQAYVGVYYKFEYCSYENSFSEQYGYSFSDYDEYACEHDADYSSENDEDYFSEDDEDYFSEHDADSSSEQYVDAYCDHYVDPCSENCVNSFCEQCIVSSSEHYIDYSSKYDENTPSELCEDDSYEHGDSFSECGENSSECDENSSECDENSSECDENSSECDENSSECDETSSEFDENSSECDENSSEYDENSSECYENSSECDENSSESGENSFSENDKYSLDFDEDYSPRTRDSSVDSSSSENDEHYHEDSSSSTNENFSPWINEYYISDTDEDLFDIDEY